VAEASGGQQMQALGWQINWWVAEVAEWWAAVANGGGWEAWWTQKLNGGGRGKWSMLKPNGGQRRQVVGSKHEW